MAQPVRYNLIIPKGTTWNPPMTWKQSDGTAINMTDYIVRMTIKTSYTGYAIVTLTTADSSIAWIDQSAGQFRPVISAATTTAITQTSGVYDLEIVDASGVVTRVMEGTVSFSSEATT